MQVKNEKNWDGHLEFEDNKVMLWNVVHKPKRGDGFAYKRGTSNRKGTGDGRNRTYETENSVGFVEK